MSWIQAAGYSDKGRVRAANEDHFCLHEQVSQDGPHLIRLDTAQERFVQQGLLLAVADGMGGYAGGEVASRIALDALAAHYCAGQAPPGPDGLERYITECLARMREALNAALRSDSALAQAGTTLAGIVLAPPDQLCVFHAGDSRVLRFAGGAAGFLRQLTVDHTPLGQAVFAGELSEADAAGHPHNGQLTRSLGLTGNTEVQIEGGLTWAVDDVFLLCSDGFHGVGRGLARTALQDALRLGGGPLELVQQLVPLAVAQDGADNTTLVVAQITVDEAPGEPHAR
jgi:PPM family protein phosphatase